MKKGFLFLIPLLCLTGCDNGTKKLICEREEDSATDELVELSYSKKNKLLNVEHIGTFRFEEKYEKDFLVSLLDAECEDFESSKGITCKVQKNKKSVSLNLKMNISKMTDEELEDMDIEDMMNYEEAKEELEDDGYICK